MKSASDLEEMVSGNLRASQKKPRSGPTRRSYTCVAERARRVLNAESDDSFVSRLHAGGARAVGSDHGVA